MPRIWEIIDNLSDEKKPRLLRGDVGYGRDENMCEAERRGLKYLFKLRRTKTVFALFRRHENGHSWSSAEDGWEAMDSTIQLSGWGRDRRCILPRRPSKDIKRIAMATQPRRSGRSKKNALMLSS
jgi:hypothetical protein